MPGWIDPNAGVSTQSLGGTAARDWLRGEFPWWDHYAGAGLPLAASMHSHALFLPFVLLLALNNGPLWLKIAMEAIAGCAMYALARKLRIQALAALVAAIGFEFCGTFAWLSDAPIMPIAFLPMFALGIEHAIQDERGKRWLLIAPAIAFSLYGGFPETAYLDGLLVLAWALIRLGQCPADQRLLAAARIAGAGIIGVLLTGPLLTTFGSLLETTSSLTDRDIITRQALNAESFVQIFFPYFTGPLGDVTISGDLPQFEHMWANLGGCLGLPILFLAVLGALGPRLRALRIGLAGWIVLSLAMSFQLFPRFNIIAYLPLMKYVAFFRYAWPTIEFAAILLAALAIDDLGRAQSIGGGRRFIPAIVALGAIIVCWVMISGDLAALLRSPISKLFFFTSASVFCLSTGLAAYLTMRKALSPSMRYYAISTIAILISVATYFVPLLSGVSGPGPDREAIRFLRENLGLNRFYSLGPIQPNYASWYRIPSLNNNFDPIPSIWADYVRDRLDPGADPSSFNGVWPPKHPEAPFDSRAEELTRHLGAFEKMGVKYILATDNPFIPQSSRPLAPVSIVQIWPDKPYDDSLVAAPRDGRIVGFSIYLATYYGATDGSLELRLCSEEACSSARADLRRAVDDGFLAMTVNEPLAVSPHSRLTFELQQVGGTYPVAIWRIDPKQSDDPNFLLTSKGAAIRFKYDTDVFPKRVYASAAMSIYELPNPSPYSEILEGACQQVAQSQDAFDLTCERESRFLRREMLFPGWTASIDGVAAPIELYDKLFQLVVIPAGAHRLVFSYAPPFILVGAAALALGLLALAGLALSPSPRRAKD